MQHDLIPSYLGDSLYFGQYSKTNKVENTCNTKQKRPSNIDTHEFDQLSDSDSTAKTVDTWESILNQVTRPIKTCTPTNIIVMPVVRAKIYENAKNLCDECKIELTLDCDDKFYCAHCGLEKNHISQFTEEKINSNGSGLQLTIKNGSSQSSKVLFRVNVDYSRYQRTTNYNAFIKYSDKIPGYILTAAHEIYERVKVIHRVIYRKSSRLGLISACTWRALINMGCTQMLTESEIAAHFGVAERYHNRADEMIRSLIDQGFLDIQSNIDQIRNFISRYIALFKIDKKYEDFICDLIKKADDEKLHIMSDSKNNTKCIGSLYMLIERLNMPITKETLAKTCGISKTTFIKYYNMICSYFKLFIPVFVKHGIPLKSSWRSAICEYFNKVNDVPVAQRRSRKIVTPQTLNDIVLSQKK